MTQPKVTITERDGSLGILPPSAGLMLAIAGCSTAGTVAAPAAYARTQDVVAAFGAGPLVEAACYHITVRGLPVLLCRTGTITAGTFDTIDVTGVTGLSVITKDAASAATDDHEYYVIFKTSGTVGVTGITYQYSLDNGRNLSQVQALGTSTTIVVPGGLTLDLTAATIVAGDVVRIRSVAPNFDSTTLTTALTALKNSIQQWSGVLLAGPLDATLFDAVETAFAGMFAVGKPHWWIGNARLPTVEESDSAYLTSVGTVFASKTSVYGALCYGQCKTTSGVTGRKYRRPIAHSYASLEASVSEEIDTADPNLGSIPGVSITDVNGNPDDHDESINPGADDARFVTYRTIDGVGVYVNRPRIFSAAGSDFDILPKRKVMNLGEIALRAYFIRRLNKPVIVSSATGFILEHEAAEIERGAVSALRAVLSAVPKASDVQFALSRTDNLLSTKTMTGQARIIPLAYPEFINLDMGFLNPALRVVTQ